MKMYLGTIISIILFLTTAASAQEMTAYSGDDTRSAATCILKITAQLFGPNTNIEGLPEPKIVLDNEVSLIDYQNEAAEQMGMIPSQITNSYIPSTNTIYLVSKYTTQKTGRTVYDSLVHEFTHYLQTHINQITPQTMSEADEEHAVRLQTKFRDTYAAQIKNGAFICPL